MLFHCAKVTTAPVLRYFDYLAKTELYVDACDYAIGAVLQQVDSEGNSHPVGYYSRRLNPADLPYCQIVDLNLLVISGKSYSGRSKHR